jgi:hypothetical protein
MEEEKVLSMDRTQLMDAVAKLPKVSAKGAEAAPGKSDAVWQQELELRKAELEAQNTRWQNETGT